MLAATKALLAAWTRTFTAMSPSPSWSRVAETVEAEAPESPTLWIMASVISGMWYPAWVCVMAMPDTVTTLPRLTCSMRPASLELSRKISLPTWPFWR